MDLHWSENTDRFDYGDEHQFTDDVSHLMLRLSDYPGVNGYAGYSKKVWTGITWTHAAIYVNGPGGIVKMGLSGGSQKPCWSRDLTQKGISIPLS